MSKNFKAFDADSNPIRKGSRIAIYHRGKVPNGVASEDWLKQIGTVQVVKAIKKGNKIQVVEGNQIYDGPHVVLMDTLNNGRGVDY